MYIVYVCRLYEHSPRIAERPLFGAEGRVKGGIVEPYPKTVRTCRIVYGDIFPAVYAVVRELIIVSGVCGDRRRTAGILICADDYIVMDTVILTACRDSRTVYIDKQIGIYMLAGAGVIAVVAERVKEGLDPRITRIGGMNILDDIIAEYHAVGDPCSVVDRARVARLVADIVNIVILEQCVAAEIAQRKVRTVIDLVVRYGNTEAAVMSGLYLTDADSRIIHAVKLCIVMDKIIVNDRLRMYHLCGIAHLTGDSAAADVAQLVVVKDISVTDKVKTGLRAVADNAILESIMISVK